jgi:putative membrane protein
MIHRLTAALVTLALAFAAPAFAQSQSKKGSLSKQDQQYFRDIAQANMAEVATGKLAQQQASSPQVKEFAEHMVKDHGQMIQEQQQMASAKGVQMPKQPKKEHQDALQKLKKAKSEQFDKAYMAQMVKDHQKTLKTVQQAAKNAKDPQLKAMAQKAQPDIEKHLQMAQQLADSASAGASGGQSKDK